jgi:hypothetical protein
MSAISNPNDPDTISAVILRRLEAATNRLASGDKRVKRLTLPALTGFTAFAVLADLEVLAGFKDLTGFAGLAGLAGFAGLAAFWSRLAEIGVTEAGDFGNPFAAFFLAGPGRFKLLL